MFASANALLLRALLERLRVHFFKSFPSSIRGRSGAHPAFRFTDVDNRLADRTRARLARVPVAGNACAASSTPPRISHLLVRRMAEAHRLLPSIFASGLATSPEKRYPVFPP